MLLRDYLRRLLAYQGLGYFNSKNVIVSSLNQELDFDSIKNEQEYRDQLRTQFNKHSNRDWTTPCEALSPYYSQTIGNWIIKLLRKKANKIKKLRIVEIGGGNGTNAIHLTRHLLSCEGVKNLQYISIDGSENMVDIQRRNITGAEEEGLNRIEIVCEDLTIHPSLFKVEEFKEKIGIKNDNKSEDDDSVMNVVLFLEVVGNLPHDKILRDKYGNWSISTINKKKDRKEVEEWMGMNLHPENQILMQMLDNLMIELEEGGERKSMKEEGLTLFQRWFQFHPQNPLKELNLRSFQRWLQRSDIGCYFPTGLFFLLLNLQSSLLSGGNNSIELFIGDFDSLPNPTLSFDQKQV